MFEEIKSTLEAEWPVFSGAPILIAVLVIVVVITVWKSRGSVDQARFDALHEHNDALEERLRLAADKYERANEEKTKLEADFAKLVRQISGQASPAALAGTSASVESDVIRFDRLWAEVGVTIAPPTGISYDAVRLDLTIIQSCTEVEPTRHMRPASVASVTKVTCLR